MKNSFFAMLSRMKYINRWGLMHNSRYETLSEHSLDVAIIAHALAVIGNCRFGKSYNEERAALCGIFHDASEILTGDMPTPVKYQNSEIKRVYKQIESDARDSLVSKLPDDMADTYRAVLSGDNDLKKLVKAADKISALIKCIEEKRMGNAEFESAYKATLGHIKRLECEEADVFLSEFVPPFELDLDKLNG